VPAQGEPLIADDEQAALDQNHLTVGARPRARSHAVARREIRALRVWAHELIDSLTGICEILDRGDAARPYAQALAAQAGKIDNVALTLRRVS